MFMLTPLVRQKSVLMFSNYGAKAECPVSGIDTGGERPSSSGQRYHSFPALKLSGFPLTANLRP